LRNLDLDTERIGMSEDLRKEMEKLKEEIASLKEQLKAMSEKAAERRRGIYIDINDSISDYVREVMEGVAEGISGELEKSVFIGPHGIRIIQGRESIEEAEVETDLVKTASTMSALGSEHRLKILAELMTSGKYINELQEKLHEITASTLSSHLAVLEEAGLVVQEKVRGRYLITMPGRMAYKMACRVARLAQRRKTE